MNYDRSLLSSPKPFLLGIEIYTSPKPFSLGIDKMGRRKNGSPCHVPILQIFLKCKLIEVVAHWFKNIDKTSKLIYMNENENRLIQCPI